MMPPMGAILRVVFLHPHAHFRLLTLLKKLYHSMEKVSRERSKKALEIFERKRHPLVNFTQKANACRPSPTGVYISNAKRQTRFIWSKSPQKSGQRPQDNCLLSKLCARLPQFSLY